MVRRRRDTQPVQTPTGMPYGQRQELEQAQAQIPLEQQPGPPPPQPNGQERLAAAVMAAQQFQMGTKPLDSPSDYPSEPITAGLALGPGPGPPQRRALADTVADLAERADDPLLMQVASTLGRMGW